MANPITMTDDQFSAAIAAGVTAALKATQGTRRLQGAEFHEKVQRIKNHEGEFAKAPKALTPPAGYAIVSDRIGQSPKTIELGMILRQGAQVKPFESGKKGFRKGSLATGAFHEHVRHGELRLLAFTPYADKLVVDRNGNVVDQMNLVPNMGGVESPIPITQAMTEEKGSFFETAYLQGIVKPAATKKVAA